MTWLALAIACLLLLAPFLVKRKGSQQRAVEDLEELAALREAELVRALNAWDRDRRESEEHA